MVYKKVKGWTSGGPSPYKYLLSIPGGGGGYNSYITVSQILRVYFILFGEMT